MFVNETGLVWLSEVVNVLSLWKGNIKVIIGDPQPQPKLFMENSENKILKKSHKFLISDRSHVTKQGTFLPCPTQEVSHP